MNEFEKLSLERKQLQSVGEVPEFFTTQGWIMFKRKYAYENETVKGAFTRISSTLAKHVPDIPEAEEAFFRIMWKGHLAPSTPVYCNTGTPRGHSVSCSGGHFGDSVKDFYDNYKEIALLSKMGYGTSGYLGGIRPRGSKISSGGEADGIVPWLDSAIDVVNKVSQGNNRRGNWAGYVPVDHGDFWEVAGYLQKNSADTNIGWMFSDDFIESLKNKNKESIEKFNRVMYLRSRFGKGYIWKQDVANRLAPDPIKNCGIQIKASNLCSEIALPQDEDHTFSCVLSSLNLAKWDEFDDDTIFWAIVFLDCVVEEMLTKARGVDGFERIVRFTEKSRALGLGAMGFATYLQQNMIPWESMEASVANVKIFKKINDEALKATQWLAKRYGEPEWCKGYGRRNATLTAIAPNVSSALLCGGVSQGVEPLVNNAYNQNTAAGEMTRCNPLLVEILKDKGVYSEELVDDIAINHLGSVQHINCLTQHEKDVLKTAPEINQHVLVKLASQRQKYIEQGQSLNLFFDTDEHYIASVTKAALLDPNIKALYYQRSIRNVRASKGSDCWSCEG